jgi:hypothetical protein
MTKAMTKSALVDALAARGRWDTLAKLSGNFDPEEVDFCRGSPNFI